MKKESKLIKSKTIDSRAKQVVEEEMKLLREEIRETWEAKCETGSASSAEINLTQINTFFYIRQHEKPNFLFSEYFFLCTNQTKPNKI